jgi:hypothetical protein
MIFEVALDRLADAFPRNQCPFCNNAFNDPAANYGDVLKQLAHVLTSLGALQNHVEVEFDLPRP